MAGEKEIILGRDGEGVTHECAGIDGQGHGHASGDAVDREISVFGRLKFPEQWTRATAQSRWRAGRSIVYVHLGIFLGVQDRCYGDAEVGGGAPEVLLIVPVSRISSQLIKIRAIGM